LCRGFALQNNRIECFKDFWFLACPEKSKANIFLDSTAAAVQLHRYEQGLLVERTQTEDKLNSVNPCTSLQGPETMETHQYARACVCSWRAPRLCLTKMYFVFFYGFVVFHGAQKKNEVRTQNPHSFLRKWLGGGNAARARE